MVSDLNKGMEKCRGRKTPFEAEDWLMADRSISTVNDWPFSYTLQYVRMHVEGSARDWLSGREFKNWLEFQIRFHATFVRTACATDSADQMRSRKQGRDETLMDYFQPKMRMCQDLLLSFDESKDHIL